MRGAVVFLLLVGCSSGGSGPIGETDGGTASSSSGGSSSGEAPATPQAIAQLNGGAAAGCATVPAFTLGAFADATAHRPVKSGETENGETANVACRVAPNGSDFAVEMTLGLGGTTVTIRSDVDATGGSHAAKLNLVSGAATWASETCTLDATGVQMGVAAGHYWAMVSCMGATSAGGETCDIFGQVRVENCTQQ
jgi:hypothetical protein